MHTSIYICAKPFEALRKSQFSDRRVSDAVVYYSRIFLVAGYLFVLSQAVDVEEYGIAQAKEHSRDKTTVIRSPLCVVVAVHTHRVMRVTCANEQTKERQNS